MKLRMIRIVFTTNGNKKGMLALRNIPFPKQKHRRALQFL